MKTESLKLIPKLRDINTGDDLPLRSIQSIEIILYQRFTGFVWLHFKHPTTEGFLPFDMSTGYPAAQIETNQTLNAPPGSIIVKQKILAYDNRYAEGVKSIIAEKNLLTVK